MMASTEPTTTPGPSPIERATFATAGIASAAVIAMELTHAPSTAIFTVSAITLVLLAWLLGEATDQFGERVGGRIAGLMNATLGNLPELVVVLLLVNEATEHPELLDVAKASLVGSVLGNVLFVLGLAFLLGGIKHGTQRFRASFAGLSATMLILAVAAIAVPDLISLQNDAAADHIDGLSICIAAVMLVVYVASTYFFLKDTDDAHAPSTPHAPRWSMRLAILVLVLAAVGVGVVSEALVGAMEPTIEQLGISPAFMGFILVPIVGNLAEHLVAVQLALRNEMDFAITIALGSSVQVAMLLIPLAIFLSHVIGNPMSLTFDVRQLLALTLTAVIVPQLVSDGESTWIEGLQLLALYAVIAIGFWY